MITSSRRRNIGLIAVILVILGLPLAAVGQPRRGQAVIAWHVTLAPSWFDPSTAPPQITAFGMLYAIHDALLRPLPGQKIGNSLAETWTESPDGRVYEFKLRRGLKFHNGDPVTAEDVKFSFERYKGTGAKIFQERVQQVEIVDPLTVRFHLREAWPDFLTFYGTSATAAGIVVPKSYLTRVGDDGFKKHPIGAGPYKFVSHTPGVEVVLDAYPEYWRHVPHIKRLTMKSVPEGTTRVAMVRNGEVDLAVALEAEDAESARRDPRLQLVATRHASIAWIEFADQWDTKSPWHDRRTRLAVNYALDRKAINDSACLGHCPPTGVIIPRVMDFALRVEPLPYDPHKAKQLLAETGYPNGLDAGDFVPIPPSSSYRRARSTLSTPSGSGCGCGQSNGRPSTLRGTRGSCAGCSWSSPATRAMRRAAWRSSSTPKGAMHTEAIPISTSCSTSKRRSAIRASARLCSIASNSSPSTA